MKTLIFTLLPFIGFSQAFIGSVDDIDKIEANKTWHIDLSIEDPDKIYELTVAIEKALEERVETAIDPYYIKGSIEEIMEAKKVSEHNAVLKQLGLSNAGDEKEKVYRIIEELERRGLR